MGLGDFWLQSNNGKKYSLKDLKDIKPEDIAKNPKFKKLIEIFNWDSDGDGKISVRNTQGKNEWESVFADLQQASVDNDLTSEEFGLYISQKSQNADLKLDDVNELLDAATQSTEEVTHANEQSIELGIVQPTITDAEFDKIKSDAYNTVLTSATKAEKLDKDYEDLHSFAKEKLSKSGKQPTLQEIVLYAAELQLLNPDIKADKKIKKGTSINLPVKSLDKKKLQLLETKGIKVEKDNYIFFQKLLELDDAKQATVLNTINNSKFKTKEEVINDVYNKTRINLADTGLTIKVGGISSTLENFITNTLKVDLSSKEGLKIYDRLSRLNQAVLDNLPKEFIVKLSKMNNITFDKLADKAEVFGIILRTDEEMKEREKNSQAYRDLKARMFMAQYVADNYTSAVTISQSADRNLNFTQGAWWIRNARPIGYTSNEQQKRDTAKENQIKKLLWDADTLSNEEFAKRMSNIMEAERTVSVSVLPGDLPVSHEAKDPSFKFDPKLAYTFMKQMQRAELAAGVAKRLEPQRKQYVERNPYVQKSDNTRVYNAQTELAKIEYTVEPLDKEELKQLTRYIKSIKTKKELFLFAKSLHYKVDVISNRVGTMIPKENQAEIAKLLEQKAKELGYAEPTRPNSISLNTFRNVFTKPIDKKVNYPKTNDKTIMETYEATKTKLLGNWNPVGEQIRIQEMEGTVGGVLDIATMILVTKGMGSMGAFVRIGNVGRNIGTATNIFKTANVVSRFTKNASRINRLAKADKVLGGLWVNGAAGALHGAAIMGAYGGLQGTVGMADNTVKNLLEGKDWSEGLGERFEQTLVMGYENAKFGLFAGFSGVLAQALGKGSVALGSKGIDKLFKTNYSKTVLDKVSSVVTEEGISGSEFFTKMQAASKAEGLVGFGYETGFFTLYHKMEEAGVDFNNEESLLTYIQNNLDEETKQSLASTYLSEGGNLAMFKIIGSLIQWVHIGRLSSGAAIEIQAKNNRALRNMNMRKVVENGKESYLVKFNENDKPIKVAPEQLMQLCEQKMFYSNVEDKVQKDGSFKLPNNQTVEYDKAKKVYRTVIDADNTVESASVEELLNQVNKITFKNRIDEQLVKENKVELNDGIVLTKTDGKYQIEITLEDGKKIPVQSEYLNDVIMRAQFVKLVCDAESARKGQRTSNQEEDYPQSVSKDEDVFLDIAESENPATVAEKRIFQQWVLDGLDKQAKPPLLSAVKSTETSSLILTGKLRENLTSRYQEMGKGFEEIAQKRSADIKELVKQNPKNKQAVADGIVKILAQELGMEGFEPPIVFEVAEGNGFFDFMNGEIVIHKNITNVKDLTEVISHEFVHVLQFRDILAQYGEEGIKEIFNNKSISENEKEARIKVALNNDYNKRLLQSYNLQRAQSGTVNDYLRRIYKDEFTNTKSAITDMQGYTDQVVEREAYNLGSEHIGNRTEGLSELNINEGLTLAERKAIMEAAQKREQKLASVTSTTQSSELLSEKARENITRFATSTAFDITLSRSRLNLTQFGKSGIPLKYSRENFIKELDALLSGLPPTERANIEAKFGIKIENTTYNQLGKEIVGIPIIPDKLNGTKSEQAVAELIRKFTVENEVQIADTATKELLESILHTFPEFAMTIGKKQHDTHSFSVDIHTLRNLQDNLANPKYAELDAESQLVLKYATILHDIGKRFLGDRQSDDGHAALSTEYASKILERFDLSDEVKSRIIKQVKNHHWFEEYNQSDGTAQDISQVGKRFETKQDFFVAEIMAKSDYMNVNETFHLSKKRNGIDNKGYMTKSEFENFIDISFRKIEEKLGYIDNDVKELSLEELDSELEQLKNAGKITNKARKNIIHYFKMSAKIGEERNLYENISIKKISDNLYTINLPSSKTIEPQKIIDLLRKINIDMANNVEKEYKQGIIGLPELKVIALELERPTDEYAHEIADACIKYKKSSGAINTYLRNGTWPEHLSATEISAIKKRIKILQQAIEANPCDDSIRLYRGDDYGIFDCANVKLENGKTLGDYLKSIEFLPEEEQNRLTEILLEENDITLFQKSFLSTSITKGARAKDEAPIQFNIITEGRVYGKILDIYHASKWDYETEYLVGQNAQIQIRKIERKRITYINKEGVEITELKWVIDAVLTMHSY